MKSLCPKDISIRLWIKSGLGMWNFQDVRAIKICFIHPLIFQMGKTEVRRGCNWARVCHRSSVGQARALAPWSSLPRSSVGCTSGNHRTKRLGHPNKLGDLQEGNPARGPWSPVQCKPYFSVSMLSSLAYSSPLTSSPGASPDSPCHLLGRTLRAADFAQGPMIVRWQWGLEAKFLVLYPVSFSCHLCLCLILRALFYPLSSLGFNPLGVPGNCGSTLQWPLRMSLSPLIGPGVIPEVW